MTSVPRESASLALPVVSTRALMLAAGVLLSLWQVWAGRLRLPTRYSVSYWVVTWDHGFVRRGLSGEINEALFGWNVGMRDGAYTLSITAGLIGGLSIMAVAWALLLRRDTRLSWFGLLLLAAPGTIRTAVALSRPDMLGLLALLGAGLATTLVSPLRRRALLAASGLWLATVILIQEASAFQIAPWVVLLVVTTAGRWDWRARLIDLISFGIAPAVSLAVVVLRGVATPAQLKALKADSATWLSGIKGGDAASYLADPVSYTVRTVLALGPVNMAGMFITGALLFLALPVLAARFAKVDVLAVFGSVPGRAVGMALVLPAFLLQLATGFDWLRWTATWGTLLLVTAGVMLLRGEALTRTPRSRIGRRRSGLLAAMMLAVALIPAGPALAYRSCAYTWVAAEWTYPFVKADAVLTGRGTSDASFPRKSCTGYHLPPRETR